MLIKLILMAGMIFMMSVIVYAADDIELSCHAKVPDEYSKDPPGWNSPTGESESVRYKKSFEAFWWNCVMVKADNIERRCPRTCSGTPAATSGSWAGATDAENQISQLLKEYNAAKVMNYLKSISKDPDGILKIRPYFPDGPRSEKVPE